VSFFSRFAGGVVCHWGFIGVGSSLGLIVGVLLVIAVVKVFNLGTSQRAHSKKWDIILGIFS
jgi:hypothetical protein